MKPTMHTNNSLPMATPTTKSNAPIHSLLSTMTPSTRAMTPAHRSLRWIAPALVAASALLLQSCKEAPAAEAATTLVAVAADYVTSELIAQPVVATGTFGPRDEIPLAFKIGGVIARVAVDEGQPVRKGQLLATLDLREIDALLDKAKVGVEKAERDQARLRRLAADSVATLAQLQDATSALDAARADAATARVNREYASIVAPEDGIVLLKTGMAGSNIGAGSTVLVLGGGARGRVMRFGLSDRDALRVKIGDVATVRFNAVPDRSFTGQVSLLGQAADMRTGTYAVEVALRDVGALPAGLVGRVEIAVRGGARAAMVPVDALLEADADSATVFTLSSEREPIATARRVRIAQLVGDRAAVAGLEDSARVVTRGAPYVTPGSRVRVVRQTTASTGAISAEGTKP